MAKKLIYFTSGLASAALLASSAYAQECGSLTIAEMNWPSAELMANVDAKILESGFGCEVELIPGATVTTFASMDEKGEPDVAPELCVNAVREPLKIAIEEGRLHSMLNGPITEVGEGWWIPPFTRDNNPEIETVLDVLARPELFPHPEDSSKGAFVGCPAGWGCQLANANLFRAFGMEEKGWILVDPGSAAGLDGSMAKAVERGENWFGYYWSPTSLIGKYGMYKVPFGIPFAGNENWDGCIVKPEQDCADPQPSAWTHSEVHTVVTDNYMQIGGVSAEYFKNRIFPGSVMNEMLVYMTEEQAGGEDAAIHFLQTREDIWTSWVSPEIVEKVRAAL